MVIGTTLAWCITRYNFMGRAVLIWVLLLPLAMPAYIIAYTYTGLLDFAGPVQSEIRELFGVSYGDYWFPEVRSLGGAIVMLTLVLYPYVFIMARTAFAEQPVSLYEASRALGVSRRRFIWQQALPLARPAIFTGTALAMMEAFADYGTVQYFGVSTFTTGIFRTWFGLGNGLAAAQLASLLCTFVLVLLLFEKWSRRNIRYFHQGQTHRPVKPRTLKGWRGFVMAFLCVLPPLFGFGIPVFQLVNWAFLSAERLLDPAFWTLAFNSLSLALTAGLVVVFLALLFAYGKRLSPGLYSRTQIQVASMGYAIPGTVIAVGVLIPLSWADRQFNQLGAALFDWTPGLILSGTSFALLLAYSVRFMSVALHNVETGLQRITPSMDQAARSLGASPSRVMRSVHLPLLKSSVLSAILLVFVDVLKELPATLVLRPFNFNTLAVKTYELASDERLAEAALPALFIVLAGLIPVVYLTRTIDKATQD